MWKITVEVVAARGLASREPGGTSDAFAVVYLDPEDAVKPRTRVLPGTLDPKWAQSFLIDARANTDYLFVEVAHHPPSGAADRSLGVALIALLDYPTNGTRKEEWHMLRPKDRVEQLPISGDVLVALTILTCATPTPPASSSASSSPMSALSPRARATMPPGMLSPRLLVKPPVPPLPAHPPPPAPAPKAQQKQQQTQQPQQPQPQPPQATTPVPSGEVLQPKHKPPSKALPPPPPTPTHTPPLQVAAAAAAASVAAAAAAKASVVVSPPFPVPASGAASALSSSAPLVVTTTPPLSPRKLRNSPSESGSAGSSSGSSGSSSSRSSSDASLEDVPAASAAPSSAASTPEKNQRTLRSDSSVTRNQMVARGLLGESEPRKRLTISAMALPPLPPLPTPGAGGFGPKSPLHAQSPLSSQDASSGVSSVCNSSSSSVYPTAAAMLCKSAASLPAPFQGNVPISKCALMGQATPVGGRRFSLSDKEGQPGQMTVLAPPFSPGAVLERSNSPAVFSSGHLRKITSLSRIPTPRKLSYRPSRKVEKKQVGHSVVDCVFIVGCGDLAAEYEEQANHAGNAMNPFEIAYTAVMHNSFPYLGPDDIPPTIWNFCFPFGLTLSKAAEPPAAPSISAYVLTSVDGQRSYVMSLSFFDRVDPAVLQDLLNRHALLSHRDATLTQQGQTVWASKAVCMMSSKPLFSFLRKLMADIYNVVINGTEDSVGLEQVVGYLYKSVPLPSPGSEAFELSMPGFALPRIWLPPENHVPLLDVPMRPLLSLLGVSNTLMLFYAMVSERKILVVSSDLAALATACEAITALLFPFQWTSVYVPLLPATLLDFLHSPMPFVMGAPRSYFFQGEESSRRQVPSDAFIVDLDSGSVTVPAGEPALQRCAEEEGDVLEADLRQIVTGELRPTSSVSYDSWSARPDQDPLAFNWLVRAAFAKFWASVLRDYRGHVMYLRVFPKPVAMFDKRAFAARRTEEADRAWVGQLVDTQMFALFLQNRALPSENVFDELVHLRAWECTPESLAHMLRQPQDQLMIAPATNIIPASTTLLPKRNGLPLRLEEGLIEAFVSTRPDPGSRPAPMRYSVQPHSSSPSPPPVPEKAEKEQQEKEPTEEEKAREQLFLRTIKSLLCNEEIIEAEQTSLQEYMKSESGRLLFTRLLGSLTIRTKGVYELSTRSFGVLSDIIKEGVVQAFVVHKYEKDFESMRAFMELLDVYYHVVEGVEYFLFTRLRTLDAWQNYAFWESTFFVRAAEETKRLYTIPGQLQVHIDRFAASTPEQKAEIVQTELESVFRLLSDVGLRMSNLGVSPVTMRRFIAKITSSVQLDEDRCKMLQQLFKTMASIELTEEKQTEPVEAEDAHMRKFSSEHALMPISTGGSAETSDWAGAFKQLLSVNTKPWIDGVRRNVEGLFASSTSSGMPSPLTSPSAARTYKGQYISRLLEGHTQPVLCLASHEGVLASGSADTTVRLWDLKGGSIGTLESHEGWVNCLAVESEHGWLVSGSYDSTVKLWDFSSMKKIRSLRGHKSSVSAVQVCPRGILSTSYDCSLSLWDTRSSKCVQNHKGHSAAITCMAYSEDLVATGSRDSTIRIWDLRAGKIAGVLPGHTDWIRSLMFVPRVLHCTVLISGGYDGQVRVWDTTPHSGACLKTFEGHRGPVNDVLWDGRFLCSAGTDATVKLWDLVAMQPAGELEGHTDEVVVLCRALDNKLVASAGYDSVVQMWDTLAHAGNRPACRQTLNRHTGRITSLLSMSSTILASAGWDTKVCLWEFSQDFR